MLSPCEPLTLSAWGFGGACVGSPQGHPISGICLEGSQDSACDCTCGSDLFQQKDTKRNQHREEVHRVQSRRDQASAARSPSWGSPMVDGGGLNSLREELR